MMLGEMIERALRSTTADGATEVFVIATLFVFCLACYQANKGKHSHFLQHAPGIMTSLGILGTFVGIVIGLLGFDVNAIDTSITVLLGGMKTAFVTSLVGMACSIAFKALDAWRFAPARDQSATPDEITAAHLFGSLERQNEKLATIASGL